MRIRNTAAIAASIALALGATACGGDAENEPAGGGAAQEQEQPKATPTPVAQIDQLTGKTTSVALDAGFVEALTALKVMPGAVGDGKITKKGSAVFPITGGNVTYYEPGSVSPYVQGNIEHTGSGLSLEAGGKKVELTDFVVDPGASVLTGTVMLDGKEAAPAGTPLFFLDGRTLNPLEAKDNGTAVLQGTTVKLKAEAADLLNQTFEIDALKEGLEIGIATITVNTK